MKKQLVVLMVVISLFSSACMSGTSQAADEGFEFSDEEAAPETDLGDAPVADDSGEGFDFADDADDSGEEGFDFTEDADDGGEEDGFEFTEDEVEDLPANQDQVLPPAGKSTWLVTNEIGSVTCPNISMEIGPEEDDVIEIEAGPPPQLELMAVEGVEESGTMYFWRDLGDYSTSIYRTDGYVPAGGSDEVIYEIIFMNLEGGDTANYMEGTITGNVQGCDVFRPFHGSIQ